MTFLSIRSHEFYPLTLTMELEKMLFGTMSLGDRWKSYLESHSKLSKKWIEATALPNPHLINAIISLEGNQVLTKDNKVIAANDGKLSEEQFASEPSDQQFDQMEKVPYDGPCEIISSLQYLIDHNSKQIIRDWEAANKQDLSPRHKDYQNSMIDPEAMLTDVILDDRQGPVIIGKNVTVLPGAKIMGPIAILPGAVVKMGAELYPGSTIGPHAVVNGEIKNSIIHEYSAKGHAGYLGDSILGRWNNFGSGTTVSNVSNTFSDVAINDWNTGEIVTFDTFKRGTITGDFVKLGILSKLYRGTSIGSFSSLAVSQPIQGNIPPFTWWSEAQKDSYQLDHLRIHCQRQMERRGKQWTENWEMKLNQLATDCYGHQKDIQE